MCAVISLLCRQSIQVVALHIFTPLSLSRLCIYFIRASLPSLFILTLTGGGCCAGLSVDERGRRKTEAVHEQLPASDVLQDVGRAGHDAATRGQGYDHARRGLWAFIHYQKTNG